MAQNHTRDLEDYVNGAFDLPHDRVVADVALLARKQEYGLLLGAYEALRSTLLEKQFSPLDAQHEAEFTMRELGGLAALYEEAHDRPGDVVIERVYQAVSPGQPFI